MPPFPILWPVFALVALIFVIWLVMVVQRMRHIGAYPPSRETFATAATSKRYFEPVELPANNLANLFELPGLFFVLAILLLQTELANDVQVALAWVFVMLRWVHSYIHIVVRNVRLRAPTYWLSVAVLMAMWIGFGVDTARQASAYSKAMATLEALPDR